MSSRKWILRCKECREQCVYAEIPSEGTSSYFLPKKPVLPSGFTFRCPSCGHNDSYTRTDLIYQDDDLTRNPATTKCS